MRKATTVGQHAANGDTIFRARKRKGLTQTKLGDAAGITYRQVIRLENGENLPSGEVRDRLAAALGIDPSLIKSGDDDHQEAALMGGQFRPGNGSTPRDQAGGSGRTGGEVAA